MKKLIQFLSVNLGYSQKPDCSNAIRAGIRQAETEQEFRNIELLIETHVYDKEQQEKLRALANCYAALKGVRQVNNLIISL